MASRHFAYGAIACVVLAPFGCAQILGFEDHTIDPGTGGDTGSTGSDAATGTSSATSAGAGGASSGAGGSTGTTTGTAGSDGQGGLSGATGVGGQTGAGGLTGAAGQTATAGATGTGGQAGSGQAGGGPAGTGGVSGMGGKAGGGGKAGTGGQAGSGQAGTGGQAGSGGQMMKDAGAPDVSPPDPLAPLASAGCGKAPALALNQWVAQTINIVTGPPKPSNFNRQYFVRLPATYNPTKLYRLAYQLPGCGAIGSAVYGLNNVAGDNLIQVGLSPQPTGQNGCFDDHAGDASIEWTFFETVHGLIRNSFCIDEHRVFASGYSSGSWIANQMACKYAKTFIRGIAVTNGGMTTGAESPTCGTNPFAGFWIHDLNDMVNPYTLTRGAVIRALTVNGCSSTFTSPPDDTNSDPYDVTGVARSSCTTSPQSCCRKMKGCPAAYPLIVCSTMGQAHGSQDDLATPGFWQFMNSL